MAENIIDTDKEDQEMIDVGFIGLGIMGRPMAGHLQAAASAVSSRRRAHCARASLRGGIVCKSGREVAEEARCRHHHGAGYAHVEAVLFGGSGVAEGLSKGKIVVDMSSSHRSQRKNLQKKSTPAVRYLDAPVSGGEVGAKAASLTIMVGGPGKGVVPEAAIREEGKNITLVGGNGDGQTTRSQPDHRGTNDCGGGRSSAVCIESRGRSGTVRQALMGGSLLRDSEVHERAHGDTNFDPGFRIELHRRISTCFGRLHGHGAVFTEYSNAQQLFNSCSRTAARPGIILRW